MRYLPTFRYSFAFLALLIGLAFSIRFSDRGFLFEPNTSSALASAPAAEGTYDLQALNIVNRVLMQLKDNYVEPERIDPNVMLVRALDRVQNQVPELVALFDAPMDASPRTVEIRVAASSETFDLPEMTSLWQMRAKLQEIFRFVQTSAADLQVDLRDLEYAAINGMLGTLDPHSVLLSPQVYEDMQTSNEGRFGGLGIVISLRNNQLTVISPMDDTPAGRAGFRAGDRIVKINDESTVNMPLDEAVNRLRGAPGTEVTVEVMRTGWSEPHVFTLVREIINTESVAWEALGDGVAYVAIRNFQRNTHDSLMGALAELEEEMGEIRGLVLDLRNNPGGLLDQAHAVSNTFLSEGVIVTTVGIGDRLREERSATVAGTQGDYPIAVLVNPGSASASEIVAGALKAHNRAVIIGDTTFGKGSVQIINPFADGSALKLTVAKYLTPGDVSIQGTGIVPDIRTVPVSVEEEFVDLYPPDRIIREGDLSAALIHNGPQEIERPSEIVKYYYEPEEFDPEAIRDPNAFEIDFEIDFARQLVLAARGTTDRPTILARTADTIERINSGQLSQVQERLRLRNVDWSEGANVIQPVSVRVETQPGVGRVHVGDTISFTVHVRNDGERSLHRVRAISHSDYARFDDHEFVIGKLAPGQSASWTVRVEVPVEDLSRYDRVEFDVHADVIDLGASAETWVEVVGQDRPRWGFTYVLDDSEGNGDGLLQVGETVRFVMDVTNTGHGAAAASTMYLRNHADAAIFLRNGRDTVDGLEPGESHRAEFEFEVRERPEDGTVQLEAIVYDSVFREYLSEKLTFAVGEEEARVRLRPGRTRASDEPVDIRAGASDAMPRIALLPAGGTLPVTATTEDWMRVEWEGGSGWVRATELELDDPIARPPSPVTEFIVFRPPLITFEDPPLRVDTDHLQLRGEITDDTLVRDYYVVVENKVSNVRSEALKITYEYLGAQSARFDTSVPLRPGPNQITVFARDGDEMRANESIFVYRDE